MSEHSAAYLRRRIEVLTEELERKLIAESLEDKFKDGDVLRVTKTFDNGSREYTYVLLKVGGNWYNTATSMGSTLQHIRSWSGLVEFFGVETILAAQKVGSWKRAF
jgi:hypothetical protein